MTRQAKTPRQRAREALDVANRAVVRLAAKKSALAAELEAITREHDQAVVRRDYLAKHPDLHAVAPSENGRPRTARTAHIPTGDDA